jgi:rhodanese-related sulfurtransferase
MSSIIADADIQDLLDRGRARGGESALPYAGALTPREAYELVRAGIARMVDVRNRYEWEFVGRFPEALLIEWKHYPSGEVNPRFIDELKARFADDEHLLFLCRSGARSDAAARAAKAAGFSNAFNILEGFEGELNEHSHRGEGGGWRSRGLPWVQS